MEYSVDTLNREEAIQLCNQWIKDWDLTPIREGMYSSHPLVMYNEKGQMLYIGYVWESDSEMAMVGFITRNTKARTSIKNARRIFVQELINYASMLGFKYIASWCADEGLKKDFRDIGFTETSNKVSEFFAEIKQI